MTSLGLNFYVSLPLHWQSEGLTKVWLMELQVEYVFCKFATVGSPAGIKPMPVCLMQCFSMTLLQTLINLYAIEWDVQNLKYYLQNGLYCYHFEL